MVSLTNEQHVRRDDTPIFDTIMEFSALSTDTKPTREWDNRPILNGSTLIEMDTSKVFIYNESSHAWLPFGG